MHQRGQSPLVNSWVWTRTTRNVPVAHPWHIGALLGPDSRGGGDLAGCAVEATHVPLASTPVAGGVATGVGGPTQPVAVAGVECEAANLVLGVAGVLWAGGTRSGRAPRS